MPAAADPTTANLPPVDSDRRWPEPGARERARRQLYLFWGLVAVLLLALSPFGELLAGSLPACPFKSLTGWPCPACGATRAALALSRFEFVHAFSHYPLAALAWVVLVGGGLLAGGSTLLGRRLPEEPRRWPGWTRGAVIVAILANWIYSILTGV